MSQPQLQDLSANNKPAIQLRLLAMLAEVASLSPEHLSLIDASGRSLPSLHASVLMFRLP